MKIRNTSRKAPKVRHAGPRAEKVSTAEVAEALGAEMNLLRELACAAALSKTYFDDLFTARDLWLMVMQNAADAAGFGAQLGRLKSGYVADIAVFDGATPVISAAAPTPAVM